MGVGGHHHAPAALLPGKTQYTLYKRVGGPQGQSGQAQKMSPPTGIRFPDRPAHSESLYQPIYPGPLEIKIFGTVIILKYLDNIKILGIFG